MKSFFYEVAQIIFEAILLPPEMRSQNRRKAIPLIPPPTLLQIPIEQQTLALFPHLRETRAYENVVNGSRLPHRGIIMNLRI